MTIDPATAYDAAPYIDLSFPKTRPAHLYTMARLMGYVPPPFRGGRILELGCAGGWNLLPLAALDPEGTYIGVDISPRQIEAAKAAADQIGLTNISFHAADIRAFDTGEPVDYIIAHGLYSWVDDDVRKRVLELCRDALSENGLAVISYNTLPGWNALRVVREMALYHATDRSDPQAFKQAAVSVLELVRAQGQAGSLYQQAIEKELRQIKESPDSYLLHDVLEGDSRPFYVHEVLSALRDLGLHYVADGDVGSDYVGNLPAEAGGFIKALPPDQERIQYIDFITNRRFRSSIVSHAAPAQGPALQPAVIHQFHLRTSLKADPARIAVPGTVQYKTSDGRAAFTLDQAPPQALMQVICRAVRPLSAAQILDEACQLLPDVSPQIFRQAFDSMGLQLVMMGHLSLHSDPGQFVEEVSRAPEVFKSARVQVGASDLVTNTLHEMVKLPVPVRGLIGSVDGSRSLADLAQLAGGEEAARTSLEFLATNGLLVR